MNTEANRGSSADENSRWPATPILVYGTFGARTPEGRRYHFRCGAALLSMVACMLLGTLFRHVMPGGFLKVAIALVPGATFAYIAWEFRRYLSGLDELARRIQLESIAWTYLSGLAFAMLLGGVGIFYDWRFNPLWFIVLEPVRAGWLYFVSRRYQ